MEGVRGWDFGCGLGNDAIVGSIARCRERGLVGYEGDVGESVEVVACGGRGGERVGVPERIVEPSAGDNLGVAGRKTLVTAATTAAMGGKSPSDRR